MARLIRDRVAMDRGVKMNCNMQHFSQLPIYDGYVEESLKKITLSKSEFGLILKPITKNMMEQYEALKIEDSKFFIDMEGSCKEPATEEQIKVLKVLAIEQINKNVEYSNAVAYCCIELIKQIMNKKVTGLFEVFEEDSLLRKVVVEGIQDFVQTKIKLKNTKLKAEYYGEVD